jgi:hypothetical protein
VQSPHLLRRLAILPLLAAAALAVGAGGAVLAACGPFTDEAADAFCPFVLEIYYLGITTGTSPTTFDPTSNVNRLQMAAFLSRTVDRVLARGSRRAALDQFWTPQNANVIGMTSLGEHPLNLKSDGADIWVAISTDAAVSRVRGSDGKLLETWTGAVLANSVLVAMGRVFVTGATSPGRLYLIDPRQPAGVVTTVATNLGVWPRGIAFDGSRIWTAGPPVSIVTPEATIPWTVTTVSVGFNYPIGILYDNSNIWITDGVANTLLKLDQNGAILQTVTVGSYPAFPAFDGTNIWVPNDYSNSISVVRAANGAVLQTLTGNGLNSPATAAFDGQRVLVTNQLGDSVSLWKASDLSEIGTFKIGATAEPGGACSDGLNFWITLGSQNKLVRF